MPAKAKGASRKTNWTTIGCVGGGCGALLFFLLCAGCGGGGYWYKVHQDAVAKEAEHQRIVDAFTPELASYLDVKSRKRGQGKFKGKVVCVDLGAKTIDGESLDFLPESLRATKPDEVGAVVWLRWREEEIGNYDDGSKVIIQVAAVTLIDKNTNTILVTKDVRGDKVENKRGKGDRLGPKPWEKIVDLLKEYAETK